MYLGSYYYTWLLYVTTKGPVPSSEIEPGALSGSREEIRVSTNQFRKQDKDIYRNKLKGRVGE